MARNGANSDRGATPARTTTTDDHATKEALIGTDRLGRRSNVSWGAIFAGVVTFLAVTVLMGLIATGMGLGGSGTAAGVWSVVALAVALAAAGFVAGALAVRSGLIHGFLTWATSLVAALVLATWLSTSLLGAAGGVLGEVTSAAAQSVSSQDASEAVDEVEENVDQEDVDQAVDEAQQTASDVADTATTGVWWAFAGMLIGAVIAALMGTVGSRSVITRDDTVRTR